MTREEKKKDRFFGLTELPPVLAGFWIESKRLSNPAAFQISEIASLQTHIEIGVLKQAAADVFAHHVALRCAMPQLDGTIYIEALPEMDEPLAYFECVDPDRSLAVWCEEPMDVEKGPLARAAVFASGTDRRLAFTLHHLICDQISIEVLFEDLTMAYWARIAGHDPVLPAAGSFIRYLQQETERGFDEDATARDLAYWSHVLKDAPFDVGLEHDRVGDHLGRGEAARHLWSSDRRANLVDVAVDRGLTPFSILLAGLALVVGRWIDTRDIVLGTTIVHRADLEHARTVGFLVRTVPLRLDWASCLTTGDLMQAAYEALIGAVEHDIASYPDIIAQEHRRRKDCPNKLFRIAIEMNYGDEINVSRALFDSDMQALPKRAVHDLLFSMHFAGSEATFRVTYDSGRFSSATAQELLAQWAHVVEALIDGPGKRLCDVRLAPAARSLDAHLNLQSAASGGITRSWIDGLAERAESNPEDVALITWEDGEEQRFTAGRLLSMALAAGSRLTATGASRFVGVPLDRAGADIAGILGCHAAGRAFVPLDMALPDDVLLSHLATYDIDTVTGAPALLSKPLFRNLRRVPADRPGDSPTLLVRPAPSDAAYGIFTSGTTGRPKGVTVPHRALDAFCEAMWDSVLSTVPNLRRSAVNAPLSFDASFQLLSCLGMKGVEVLLVPLHVRRDPLALAKFVSSQEVSVLDCTPTIARLLLQAGCLNPRTSLIVGGEPINEDLWDELARHPAPMFNVYGPTEGTVNATSCPIEGRRPNIGRPLPGVAAWIVGDHGSLVARGEVGDICLTGPQVALGYMGASEEENARFRPATFAPVEKSHCYRTGDRGHLSADDRLIFRGRRDAQVKLGGVRVEVAGIERTLHALDGVEDAAVVAVGQVGQLPRLVAFFVGRADVLDLRIGLSKGHPLWEVPAIFVPLAALPHSPSGKLDRGALQKMATAAERPVPLARTEVPTEAAIETATMRVLVDVWGEMFGRRVGLDDDFFALGGHSLLMLRLMARLREKLGHDVSIGALFSATRLRDMARVIDQTIPLTPVRSTVVAMGDGPGMPLILCHPLGGEVLAYRRLCALVATDSPRPVFACRSRSLVDGSAEASTPNEMAARYAADLQAVLPDGPVAIMGWSLGGLIALVLARHLVELGREVAFVEVWDCGLSTRQPLLGTDHLRLALRIAFGARMAETFDGAANFEVFLQDCASLDRRAQLDAVMARARMFGIASEQSDPTAIDVLSMHLDLSMHHAALFETWWPPRLDVPVSSVLSKHSLDLGFVSRTRWEDFTTGEVTESVVDGDHFSMITSEKVHDTAYRLVHRLGATK